MPPSKKEVETGAPPPTLMDCLVDPYRELGLRAVKWGVPGTEIKEPLPWKTGTPPWPTNGWEALTAIAEERRVREGRIDEPTVYLLNMSFRTVEKLLVPTDAFAEGPNGTLIRQWVEQDYEPFSLMGPLPISLAIKTMRPDARDNPASGTHQTRHIWLPAPPGRCSRKVAFQDPKFQNRTFASCPYRDCIDHPAMAAADPSSPSSGPEVVWSVSQAQRFGAGLLNEYAIERFMEQIDLRPEVAGYLTWTMRLRQQNRRERQGLGAISKVRKRATH